MKDNRQIHVPESEIEIASVRAQGPGGQNVNKVASAIHLRFDIQASSLPEEIKQRLLQARDYRISKEGVVVIKAQRHRTREKNLEDALDRLNQLVAGASRRPRPRKKTAPPTASKAKRLDEKTRRGYIKKTRRRISGDE